MQNPMIYTLLKNAIMSFFFFLSLAMVFGFAPVEFAVFRIEKPDSKHKIT